MSCLKEVLREAEECGAPAFPVKDVTILNTPQEFYTTLMNGIRGAKERIVLAALYLGPEEQAMATALQESTARVSLLFDGNRGQRGNPSTKELLGHLHPHLYEHAASVAWPWRWLPWRWREVFGCSHMKFAILDNQVILTGANLSRDYFTNRADRYLLIEDPDLADYYEELASSLKQGRMMPKAEKSRVAMADIWVIPTIDWPGFKQETLLCNKILSLNCWTHGWLSTAYLNPTDSFLKRLPRSWPILTSAPQANGFYGSKGLTSLIPSLYQHRVNMLKLLGHPVWEYSRPGWTFHAKGLWLQSNEGHMVTAIGSSNYGYRSEHRDLENQAWIVTRDPKLISKLQAERDSLFAHAHEVEAITSSSWLVRLLSPLVNSIL